MRLNRDFFNQPTLTVAPLLLGATLVRQTATGIKKGIITEVEAYLADDPASHAFRGQTPRNSVMWQAGGLAYIYLIYGRHHCLNVTTEPKSYPGAVLIRNLQPIEGFDEPTAPIVGPGRVCKALEITLANNGLDLTTSEELFVEQSQSQPIEYETLPRIGISQAKVKLWRFRIF